MVRPRIPITLFYIKNQGLSLGLLLAQFMQ